MVREACRLLDEARRAGRGATTTRLADAPELERAWRAYARRPRRGATKDARRLADSTRGIVARALRFLADQGFLAAGRATNGRHLPHHRRATRSRSASWPADAALADLLALGVVPVATAAPRCARRRHRRPGRRRRPALPRRRSGARPAEGESMYELSRVRLLLRRARRAPATRTSCSTSAASAPGVDRARSRTASSSDGARPARPRRPPRRGVLFLENGGGKSVLIKLIFSVMLPGRRQVVGAASSGVLREVRRWPTTRARRAGVAAHRAPASGSSPARSASGAGTSVSADPRKLADAWYSFRPDPA